MRLFPLFIVFLFLIIGCSSGPQPMKFVCGFSTNEFNARAMDTLTEYKFSILSASSDSITTIKRIDDGMSDRTVYVTVRHDSINGEATMFVRTLVRFQGNETEIFFDEKPRLTNDFRSDFRPVLNALRTMCTPPSKKKKRKT
ncbi:MAG: hypothetical protein HYZ54_03115 [Ignavibacteriae bacterium]|nr:hypothetical protein [Ignavibacteriota bacterium]